MKNNALCSAVCGTVSTYSLCFETESPFFLFVLVCGDTECALLSDTDLKPVQFAESIFESDFVYLSVYLHGCM